MKTNKIIYGALFITMIVIFERLFSIQTPIVRIGFKFLPSMLSGVFFSPLMAGVISAMADIIGINLFPSGYPFFIGFTISAFLCGAIYGFAFYKKEITYKNVILAVILKVVLVDMLLTSVWVYMTTGKALMLLLPPRIIKCLVFIPVETLSFMIIAKALGKNPVLKKVVSEQY